LLVAAIASQVVANRRIIDPTGYLDEPVAVLVAH
jgi:hypothetical protein